MEDRGPIQENVKQMRQTVIKSVCMPLELAIFAEKHGISLSKALQGALRNMEREKNGELLESNASLNQRINRISDNLQNAMRFMEQKGVIDEFLEQKTP